MSIKIQENENFGMQLKINRIRKGYSVKELARKSGISATTINWTEVGRTSDMRLDSVIRLAEVLDISLEELIVERKVIV